MESTIVSDDGATVYVVLKPNLGNAGHLMIQHARNEELDICLYGAKCHSGFADDEEVGE